MNIPPAGAFHGCMKIKSILIAVAGIMAVSVLATPVQAGDRRRNYYNNNDCYNGGRSYGYYQPRYYQPVRYYQPRREVVYYRNSGPNPIALVAGILGWNNNRNCR